MRLLPLAGLLALLAACGSGGMTEPPGAQPERYETTAFVLEDGGHGPELCLGAIATSYPPQCGGLPLAGWDWGAVEGEERAHGTKWGEYHVVGTYDGRTLTVEDVGPPRHERAAAEPGFSTPCGEPPGGWAGLWQGETGLEDATAYAERRPEHVATWVTQLGRPTEGETPFILNMVFTSAAEEHEAELRRRWSGPLCVVEREDAPTADELERIRSEAESLLDERGVERLASATLPHLSLVEIDVAADPGGVAQAALDDRFGPSRVELDPALTPVE